MKPQGLIILFHTHEEDMA